MAILDYDECSICFEKISSYSNVYDSKFSVGAICENCNNCFGDKEREILIHVFNVARGAFEGENDYLIRVKDVLHDVQSVLKRSREFFTPESVFLMILKRSCIYCLNLNFFAEFNMKCQPLNSDQSLCFICNGKLVNDFKHQNISQKPEFICHNCLQKFSDEEIQTITYLLRKYGGFFGKLKAEKVEITQIASDLMNKLERMKDFSLLIEINENYLHNALLHGYTPQDFIEELKEI